MTMSARKGAFASSFNGPCQGTVYIFFISSIKLKWKKGSLNSDQKRHASYTQPARIHMLVKNDNKCILLAHRSEKEEEDSKPFFSFVVSTSKALTSQLTA